MSYANDLTANPGLARVDDTSQATGLEAVVSSSEALSSLRGMSDAAADVTECRCPEPCERDHANE
jgi:hypothetical protein